MSHPVDCAIHSFGRPLGLVETCRSITPASESLPSVFSSKPTTSLPVKSVLGSSRTFKWRVVEETYWSGMATYDSPPHNNAPATPQAAVIRPNAHVVICIFNAPSRTSNTSLQPRPASSRRHRYGVGRVEPAGEPNQPLT